MVVFGFGFTEDYDVSVRRFMCLGVLVYMRAWGRFAPLDSICAWKRACVHAKYSSPGVCGGELGYCSRCLISLFGQTPALVEGPSGVFLLKHAHAHAHKDVILLRLAS